MLFKKCWQMKKKHSLSMEANPNNFPNLSKWIFVLTEVPTLKTVGLVSIWKASSIPHQCLNYSWEMKLLTWNCYKLLFYIRQVEILHPGLLRNKKRKWVWNDHLKYIAEVIVKTFLNLQMAFFKRLICSLKSLWFRQNGIHWVKKLSINSA